MLPWPTGVLFLAQTSWRETANLEARNPGRSGEHPYLLTSAPSSLSYSGTRAVMIQVLAGA